MGSFHVHSTNIITTSDRLLLQLPLQLLLLLHLIVQFIISKHRCPCARSRNRVHRRAPTRIDCVPNSVVRQPLRQRNKDFSDLPLVLETPERHSETIFGMKAKLKSMLSPIFPCLTPASGPISPPPRHPPSPSAAGALARAGSRAPRRPPADRRRA